MIATFVSTIKANVFNLIPPAVDPAAPPTNINPVNKKFKDSVVEPTFKLLNPEDLLLTDWKSELIILSVIDREPRVSGFWYSRTSMRMPPTIINKPAQNTTNLEFRFRRVKLLDFIMSENTIYPSPPINVISIVVMRSTLLFWNCEKLSTLLKKTNPELLKLEMA
jgi:hypothetical protein